MTAEILGSSGESKKSPQGTGRYQTHNLTQGACPPEDLLISGCLMALQGYSIISLWYLLQRILPVLGCALQPRGGATARPHSMWAVTESLHLLQSKGEGLHGDIWIMAAWGHLQSQSWGKDLTATLNLYIPHWLKSNAEGIWAWVFPWLGLYLSVLLRKSSDFDFPAPNTLASLYFHENVQKSLEFFSGSSSSEALKTDKVNFLTPQAGPGWQMPVCLSELSVTAASPNPSSAFDQCHSPA